MTTNNGVNGVNIKEVEEMKATEGTGVEGKSYEQVIEEALNTPVKEKVAIPSKEYILSEILKGEFDFSESIKFDGKLYIKHGEEVFKLNLVKCKKEVDFEKMEKNQEKIDKKMADIAKLQAQISKLKRI